MLTTKSSRVAAVHGLSVDDELVLQGIENGKAWSIVIKVETGRQGGSAVRGQRLLRPPWRLHPAVKCLGSPEHDETKRAGGRGETMMMEERPRRMSVSLVVIAVLAVAQGIFGLLRALQWIQIGSDMVTRGLLLLPIVGAMALARAALVALLAVLYGLIAWGLLARRGWVRPLGITVALANLALVALPLLKGETPGWALLVVIVPVILVVYLLAPAGRRAVGAGQG